MKFLKRTNRWLRLALIRYRLPKLCEANPKVLRNVRLILFDFDGVFTKNNVLVDQSGVESVECSRFDGIGLNSLRANGIKTQVISTESNPVVSVRCKKLCIEVNQGVKNKEEILLNIAKTYGLDLHQVMFVGNDVNDIPAFLKAGISVAVNDAHPDILKYVNFLTERKGGEGCVREICDIIDKLYKEKSDV